MCHEFIWEISPTCRQRQKSSSPVGLEVDECLENAKTPDLAEKIQQKNNNKWAMVVGCPVEGKYFQPRPLQSLCICDNRFIPVSASYLHVLFADMFSLSIICLHSSDILQRQHYIWFSYKCRRGHNFDIFKTN